MFKTLSAAMLLMALAITAFADYDTYSGEKPDDCPFKPKTVDNAHLAFTDYGTKIQLMFPDGKVAKSPVIFPIGVK